MHHRMAPPKTGWSSLNVVIFPPVMRLVPDDPKQWPPRLDFFGIKTASSSLIIFQRAKISTRSITHLCWCNWRTFWKKMPRGRKVTKGVLFLHDNIPAHRVLAIQKKLAYLGFQCLDHPPYSPDLASSDYHLFSGLKKRLKGRHFSSDAKVIAAAETWLDGQVSEFFWVACKSKSNGLRSVLSFVGGMLNKSRVWSL